MKIYESTLIFVCRHSFHGETMAAILDYDWKGSNGTSDKEWQGDAWID